MYMPRLYAFADEASAAVDGQIAAMRRNGLNGLEIRNADGTNVSDLTLAAAREIRRKLDGAGLTTWAIGSPLGKIGIDEDFAPHLEKLRHTLEVADALGARNIRLFSFYIPKGRDPEEFREAVIDRLGQFLRAAEDTGIDLCHENEKGIYGDAAPRCAELHRALPALKAVFDPANFIQCGQETLSAWRLLKPWVKYMHVKDCRSDGTVVPAGRGIGNLPEILNDYLSAPDRALTLEPHLKVFDGLKALERAYDRSAVDDYEYESNDAAFDAACAALREILKEA